MLGYVTKAINSAKLS